MIEFTNAHLHGFLPDMFSEYDPRPAQEQLHTAYDHGGGVQPFEGFDLTLNRKAPGSSAVKYPGDPKMRCIGYAKLRDELILVFEHSWVCIVQPDDSFIMTRCD